MITGEREALTSATVTRGVSVLRIRLCAEIRRKCLPPNSDKEAVADFSLKHCEDTLMFCETSCKNTAFHAQHVTRPIYRIAVRVFRTIALCCCSFRVFRQKSDENLIKGFEMMQSAADAGDKHSIYSLADACRTGIGLPNNRCRV